MAHFAMICEQHITQPCAILLYGDLGAGKTTFAQQFIHARLPHVEVISPTFTLFQIYDEVTPSLLHADLYRLRGIDDVEATGLFDYLSNSISLIEWPERLEMYPLKNTLSIKISITDNDTRKLEIK